MYGVPSKLKHGDDSATSCLLSHGKVSIYKRAFFPACFTSVRGVLSFEEREKSTYVEIIVAYVRQFSRSLNISIKRNSPNRTVDTLEYAN